MKEARWRTMWLCICVVAVCTGCSVPGLPHPSSTAPQTNTGTNFPKGPSDAGPDGAGADNQASSANDVKGAANSTPSQTMPAPTGTGPVTVTASLPPSAHIEVPVQNQLPQLPNGCEVTSLSMLFTAVGDPVSRFMLADDVAKAPGKLVKDKQGKIVSWGDPNVGFVGSIGDHPGYAVYHGPIVQLINRFLPGRAINLTGQPFDAVLAEVASGAPVEVWTNQTFKPLADNEFVTWQSPEGPVRATFDEHAVLVVGYDDHNIYINNPLGGIKNQTLPRQPFIAAWQQMGSQAVTITPAPQSKSLSP